MIIILVLCKTTKDHSLVDTIQDPRIKITLEETNIRVEISIENTIEEDQGHMKIKDSTEAIISIEAREEAIHLLKREVHIKETITINNKKDHTLNNPINLYLTIHTSMDLNLKISTLIKVEVSLFKQFNLINQGKYKKIDFLIIEIL